MHVTEIELSNFKTIKDFKADFTGGIYLVTGENEIGKSTLLNAIGMLLTGERSSNLLTHGEEKGFAKMTVGEGENAYEVELRFTEKNPRGTLTVCKKGSALKSNNLTALQSIFKYQDFDAHEFVKWSETTEGRRKQVEIVKSLLPLEVQNRILAIDNDVLKIKESRKDDNANIKAYSSVLDKSGLTPEDVEKYAEPKDLDELIAKKTEAVTFNEDLTKFKTRYDERALDITKAETDKKELSKTNKETIAKLEEEKKAITAKINKIKTDEKIALDLADKKVKELQDKQSNYITWAKGKEPKILTEIEEEINSITEFNQKAASVVEYKKNKEELVKANRLKEEKETKLSNYATERQQLIDNSELPIKGLDFADDGLILNGVPFKTGEVSTSQEMEVAAKLIIAKNPTVKVFRIAQGESLGTARLNAIVDFANANGYQGFIEEVHRGQQELIVENYEIKK
jgi:energy-coupling factor transporter ATP-binding protein EcfA2